MPGCGRTNTLGNTMNSEPFSSTADETRIYEDDPGSAQVPKMSVGGRESNIKDKMKPERDGLGKDRRAWRRRRMPYKRPHPREQRPIKAGPYRDISSSNSRGQRSASCGAVVQR